MQEEAKVTAIDESGVTLVSEVKSTCNSCQQVESCASGQVAKAIPHKQLMVKLPNNMAVNVGQKVTIELPQRSLLQSAWQVYCIPLLALIIFAGLGELASVQWLWWHELLTVVLSFLGGFLGFKLAKHLQNKLNVQASLTPTIVKKHPETINVAEIIH